MAHLYIKSGAFIKMLFFDRFRDVESELYIGAGMLLLTKRLLDQVRDLRLRIKDIDFVWALQL